MPYLRARVFRHLDREESSVDEDKLLEIDEELDIVTGLTVSKENNIVDSFELELGAKGNVRFSKVNLMLNYGSEDLPSEEIEELLKRVYDAIGTEPLGSLNLELKDSIEGDGGLSKFVEIKDDAISNLESIRFEHKDGGVVSIRNTNQVTVSTNLKHEDIDQMSEKIQKLEDTLEGLKGAE